MSKVWVVCDTGYKYDSARQWGEIEYLTTRGEFNPMRVESLAKLLQSKIDGVGPQDWLLLSGTPIVNVVATLMIYKKFGAVRLLLYDVKRGCYQPQALTDRELDILETPSHV